MAKAHRQHSGTRRSIRVVGIALVPFLVLTGAACGGGGKSTGKGKSGGSSSGRSTGGGVGKSSGGSGTSSGGGNTYTQPPRVPAAVPNWEALTGVLVTSADLPDRPSVSVANERAPRPLLADNPACQPLFDLMALQATVQPTAYLTAMVGTAQGGKRATQVNLAAFPAGDAKGFWDKGKAALDTCTSFAGTDIGGNRVQFTTAKPQAPSYGDESFAFTLTTKSTVQSPGTWVIARVGGNLAEFASDDAQMPDAAVVTKQIDKLRTLK